MKSFIYMKLSTLIIASIIFLSSCADVRVTHSWRSNEAVKNKFNKILVVGLLKSSDRELRNQMERHLRDDLLNIGYNAVTSIDEYGPKSFENIKEDELLKKLDSNGIDAVLSVVLLDRKRERYYVPGRVYYSPFYMHHYYRFWGYYDLMFDRIYSPGYYQSSTKFFWESNLYDMKTKQLLYSVQTESFDPDATSTLAHQYGNIIINDMEKQGVLIK